ncbi:MAG: hypothetical protein HUU28_14635 [Planctomycetaceae bacterium]|nr:hypothetical protein [Planctomycetaceae bacterium]
MKQDSEHAHDHGHDHGQGAAHGHGAPYVWQPGEKQRKAALWVVGGGAFLIVLGLALRWIADTWFA